MEKITDQKITILSPGGNDTALIKGIVAKSQRRKINDLVMKKFPNVEQVGFYSSRRLEMAGGEFCGNALRSLAFLLLRNKAGQIFLNVSGSKQKLLCGVTKNGEAFAQMPIYKSFKKIQKLSKDTILVNLQGISHIVTPKPSGMDQSQLKKLAKKLLKQNQLLSKTPAAGVMFITEKNNKIFVDPVVWVRDLETLFYETACASGTTAIGLAKAVNQQNSDQSYSITQPSGKLIKISITRERRKFRKAIISGPITTLKGGE